MKTRLSIIATLFAFLALSASAARAAVPTASDYANLASQINALSASYSNLVATGSPIPTADLQAATATLSGASATILSMQYRVPAFTYEDVEASLLIAANSNVLKISFCSPGGTSVLDAPTASHFLAISSAYLAARAIVAVYAATQTPASASATPQAVLEPSYKVEVVPIPNATYKVEVVPIPNATTTATAVPLARTAIRSLQ